VSVIAAENWCFLSGRIAGLESRMIRNDYMQRMATVEGLNEVYLSISDTSYKDSFPIIEKLYEADSIISDAYTDRVKEVARYSPSPEVVGMFLGTFDFWNFKAYLKNTLTDLEVERIEHGAVSDEAWERVHNDLKTDLPRFWYQAAGIIRAEAREDQPGQTPEIIDLALDSEYLIQQVNTARAIGCPIIINWAEGLKTIKGVEIIWRTRAAGHNAGLLRRLFLRDELDDPILRELLDLPLDEWPDRLRTSILEPIVDEVFAATDRDRLTAYARLSEDLVLDRVRPAKNVAFGPDRVFGYLCGLRTEAYNLRLILSGKVNKISTSLLQARVRRQYV
jgi:V/A-type H+-transporting ATPase subunit C